EALAVRVRDLVGAREFPLVLGGHCHILLGNMLGLRSLGRYGLVFVDGQDDFSHVSDPDRHRGFFAASGLDLALVTGNGPDELSNLHGLRPYVDERHVVLFGMYRDPGDDEALAREVGAGNGDASAGGAFRIERIRAIGARAAAEEALRFLEAQPLEGFWIHVDADVLDRAVDPESPGGDRLEFDELTEALRVFVASERAAGMELTIDDPELDPDGVHGDRLVDSIVRAFVPHG
ncbi:MAG TPA: arginase family protein, partial [Candidatus Acidoferrum sp.]|nr:arginase family protein [Candidatus Acidoferrum sp.]